MLIIPDIPDKMLIFTTSLKNGFSRLNFFCVERTNLPGCVCRYQTPLRHTRRIAWRGRHHGRMFPPVRSLCDQPFGSDYQPRLSGRRFLLRALGLRHRLRLRRSVAQNVAQGFLQTTSGAPSPHGHHGGARRRTVLLLRSVRGFSGNRRDALVAGPADLPAGLYDVPCAPGLGHSGLGRNLSAQRPRLVAALRIRPISSMRSSSAASRNSCWACWWPPPQC